MQTLQGATTRNSSFIFDIAFCTFFYAIAMQFLQCCQKLKNYIPCNFTLINSQNSDKKIGKHTFWNNPHKIQQTGTSICNNSWETLVERFVQENNDPEEIDFEADEMNLTKIVRLEGCNKWK